MNYKFISFILTGLLIQGILHGASTSSSSSSRSSSKAGTETYESLVRAFPQDPTLIIEEALILKPDLVEKLILNIFDTYKIKIIPPLIKLILEHNKHLGDTINIKEKIPAPKDLDPLSSSTTDYLKEILESGTIYGIGSQKHTNELLHIFIEIGPRPATVSRFGFILCNWLIHCSYDPLKKILIWDKGQGDVCDLSFLQDIFAHTPSIEGPPQEYDKATKKSSLDLPQRDGSILHVRCFPMSSILLYWVDITNIKAAVYITPRPMIRAKRRPAENAASSNSSSSSSSTSSN
jgi:hypothetical protein